MKQALRAWQQLAKIKFLLIPISLTLITKSHLTLLSRCKTSLEYLSWPSSFQRTFARDCVLRWAPDHLVPILLSIKHKHLLESCSLTSLSRRSNVLSYTSAELTRIKVLLQSANRERNKSPHEHSLANSGCYPQLPTNGKGHNLREARPTAFRSRWPAQTIMGNEALRSKTLFPPVTGYMHAPVPWRTSFSKKN